MEKKIIANNDNIESIVNSEIRRLGFNADLNHIDVSGVVNMWGLFDDIDFYGDISKWDVSNVENMGWMFDRSKFNGDISNWDVGNVKNMYRMFNRSAFNGDISNWDVGNVNNMYKMFENSLFDKNIDMWNYNFKSAEEDPDRFNLSTKGNHTLIEKYAKALKSKNFDLADRIKYKMNVIRIKYHVEGIKENKHLVSIEDNILKEFKEYLWKRR